MALEIHVAGPGLDVTRRIAPGDEPLVVGRDPECDICLPDPERTVSRRHLELWAERGELHFRVVSTVNGVEMQFGEAPPGARGVLPDGQSMKVGDYVLGVAPQKRKEDPWAAFDRGASGGVPDAPAQAAQPDDPFSDWGFNTTFGPSQHAGGRAEGAPVEEGDLPAFFRGLGVDSGTVTKGELEAMGRLVRVLVLGVLDLHASATGAKDELRSEDRTMLASRDNNPLKADWPVDTKMRYLFGGRIAAAGYVPVERAVREVLVDLVAHNAASACAARAAVEGTLKDLAPSSLRAKLLGDGPKLFEGARAWDAFCKWHEEQGADIAAWTQRQLDRHFTEAYLRESLRIRRETKKQ